MIVSYDYASFGKSMIYLTIILIMLCSFLAVLFKKAVLQKRILLNTYIPSIFQKEFEETNQLYPRHLEDTVVLFTDMVGFTKISSQLTPDALISLLGDYFQEFDMFCEEESMVKIKTIGDSFMALGNKSLNANFNYSNSITLGHKMIEFTKAYSTRKRVSLELRVGIHIGGIMIGTIGKDKPYLDIWGQTVNLASRLESHGEKSRVNISEDLIQRLDKSKYTIIERGLVEVKNAEPMQMYFVE